VTEFIPFPKIARLSREIIVTEKIDGTNTQVFVGEDGEVLAGSRTRWITPQADNFGFAAWVEKNREELRNLGPGRHFGEWWGQGIQRRYGLTKKRFSLFNVSRWGPEGADVASLPACCHVVPVLYRGSFSEEAISGALAALGGRGSLAAPGFMEPEGVVVFHVAAGIAFKKTLLGDEKPKGSREAA